MRTFKGLQWYAQRTLLGYRTFMATWKLGTSTKEAPGNERPPTPEDEAAWDNGVVMNDGGYPSVRSALAENRRFGSAETSEKKL